MQLFSVSAFVQYVNDTFKAIWDANEVAIEGEVSEFKISQGQWVNFNLKDEEAVISVFTTAWKMHLPLQDGMRVRVFGNPRIYSKFGKFSINAEKIELIGEGGLRKALEALRNKLLAEGLFDSTRKRVLPRFPHKIALIASRESAAFGDFIRILNERWGGVEIDVYHVQVQGEAAPKQIIEAIKAANKHVNEQGQSIYDVLVLTRGGGSLEELMAFNHELLVREIYASKIPTLVGIGHERDITLAEEVADVRGSTPTDCARRLVPDRQDVLYSLAAMQTRIFETMEEMVVSRQRTVEEVLMKGDHWLQRVRAKIDPLFEQLNQRVVFWFERLQQRVIHLTSLVHNLDPQIVLKRGYALIRDRSGKALTSVHQMAEKKEIRIQLHDGELDAMIEGRASQPTLL